MGEEIRLPPEADSVGAARRWASERVEPRAGAAAAETASLLVSELVSNVVLHARTPCEVSLREAGAGLRLSVRDWSERLPRAVPPAEPLGMSGRGLLLVQHLSDAHGVDPEPTGGKSVWFEIHVAAVELR